MKIALVSPYIFNEKGSLSDHQDIEALFRPVYDKHSFRRPNISLCTLAGLLDENMEWDYLDEQYGPIDTSKHYDIVAISIMTVNAYHGYALAKEFKKTGAHVVIGGIHATAIPMEVAEHADSVVVGEGEYAWLKFLEDFKRGCPQKIYQGGRVDLDDSPPPRYDVFPNEDFYSSLYEKEIFTYQFSRGCPFQCTFCASSILYGKKYRIKSVDKYIREMSVGIERSDNHMHFFADDNVFANQRVSLELLEEIKKLKIQWVGAADISVAKNDKLLKLIRDSGCYFLTIGFETLSPENGCELDPFKANEITHYDEYVARIHDHGINIFAAFILGFDNDLPDVFERMYEFTVKHKIFTCNPAILTPYPATEIYYRYTKENRLLYDNFWNKCTGLNVLFEPKNMTQDKLLEGYYYLLVKLNNRELADRTFFIPENQKDKKEDIIRKLFLQEHSH